MKRCSNKTTEIGEMEKHVSEHTTPEVTLVGHGGIEFFLSKGSQTDPLFPRNTVWKQIPVMRINKRK